MVDEITAHLMDAIKALKNQGDHEVVQQAIRDAERALENWKAAQRAFAKEV